MQCMYSVIQLPKDILLWTRIFLMCLHDYMSMYGISFQSNDDVYYKCKIAKMCQSLMFSEIWMKFVQSKCPFLVTMPGGYFLRSAESFIKIIHFYTPFSKKSGYRYTVLAPSVWNNYFCHIFLRKYWSLPGKLSLGDVQMNL